MAKFVELLIVGGGTGGITMAARMQKHLGEDKIAIIEPSDTHYYQPMWTFVGAGLKQIEDTARPMGSLIPEGVEWIKDSVEKINPQAKTVQLKGGQTIQFGYLIVATGLQLNWDAIKGAREALGKNGVCSIYDSHQAELTQKMLKDFSGGEALFTMPPVPIKCAGAPQKIMYLAEEIFREKGIREKTRVHFYTTGKAMFGIPVFANKLNEVIKRKNIHPHFFHKLVEIKPTEKKAVFKILKEVTVGSVVEIHEDGQEEIAYDLLHVVPPMKAHDFIADSGLAYTDGPQKGWLKVHQFSLQHHDYPYIFGIGDVTGVPNSKTGAAIRKMAPVVEENLLAQMDGRPLTGHYNGYSSCPLVTQKGKVILAEFGYDSVLLPTFPLDPAQERTSMWILKAYILPQLYWHGMLKGRA